MNLKHFILFVMIYSEIFNSSPITKRTCKFFVNYTELNGQLSEFWLNPYSVNNFAYTPNDDQIINVFQLNELKCEEVTDKKLKAQIANVISIVSCKSWHLHPDSVDFVSYLGNIDFGQENIQTRMYYISINGGKDYSHYLALGVNCDEDGLIISYVNLSEGTILAGFSDLTYTHFSKTKFTIVESFPSDIAVSDYDKPIVIKKIKLLKSGKCN